MDKELTQYLAAHSDRDGSEQPRSIADGCDKPELHAFVKVDLDQQRIVHLDPLADLAAVERERDELRAKVARVEALHFRRPWSFLRDSLVFGQATHPDQCNHCRRDWPCETVAALEGGGDE